MARLPVAAEDRTGYDREQSFGGWIDADRDGCNTRMEVLLTEAVEAPAVTGRCILAGGPLVLQARQRPAEAGAAAHPQTDTPAPRVLACAARENLGEFELAGPRSLVPPCPRRP
ncbi:hypothetical protein ACWDZW_29420 [Streptomyces coeruleorubidus]